MFPRTLAAFATVVLLLQAAQARPGTWPQFEGYFRNIVPIANEAYAKTFYDKQFAGFKAFFTETVVESAEVLGQVVKFVPNLEIESSKSQIYVDKMQNFIKRVEDYTTDIQGDVFVLYEDFNSFGADFDLTAVTDEAKAIGDLLRSNGWNELVFGSMFRLSENIMRAYAEIGVYINSLSAAERVQEVKLIDWYDSILDQSKRGKIKNLRKFVKPTKL